MTNKNNYQLIWEKIDELVFQATFFDADTIPHSYLYKIIYENIPRATLNEKRSEYFLALGYINYFSNKDGTSLKTLRLLEHALKYNKDNYTAWLYLGYWRFDNKQWEDALNAFRSIPDDVLEHYDVILRGYPEIIRRKY